MKCAIEAEVVESEPIRPSPVVALNRAIAVAELEGPERGLQGLRAIEGPERLLSYPFYSAAFGELELRRRKRKVAREHFEGGAAAGQEPDGAAIFAKARGRLRSGRP